MGTHGYYIYKLKGIYYVFYIQYDAHELSEIIPHELSGLSNDNLKEIEQSLTRITSIEDYKAICQSAGNPKKASSFQGIMSSCLHPEKHVLQYVMNELPDDWELDYTDVLVDFDEHRFAYGGEN